MRSIAMAIRQLSHRSMIYSGVGFASGMNNGRGMGMGMGMGRGRGAAEGAAPAPGECPSASDSRMSHALRTLQGVNMQLGNQGAPRWGTPGARAHHARRPRARRRPVDPLNRGDYSSTASSDLEIRCPVSATSIR